MSHHIYLSSLGGSGENGRNCHLIEVDNEIILLDCGVKREIIDGVVGFYPALTKEIVKRIKCVFLSHCHEDHVASLPLLYHLGYEGKVYATKETIQETLGFVKKWMTFVDKQNGTLPFEKEDVSKIVFEEIQLGEQNLFDFKVKAGRSGHVLGACWYIFDIYGKKVLYTGDMVLQSASLATDMPTYCDGAIMNGAYAGQHLNQMQQYERLLDAVKTTYQNGGSVLLPIPPKGRGIDITLFLDERLTNEDIYVEKAVIDSKNALSSQKAWINDNFKTQLSSKVHVISSDEERIEALQKPQGIYITGDGMITTDVSMIYYQSIKSSSKNLILVTGHAATGTIAAGILDDTYRKENGVETKADKIIFKVHLDDDDIYTLSKQTNLSQVVLFHADSYKNEDISKRLKLENIECCSLVYPNKIEL